ncbi:MAG: hypothetical protein DRI92_05320 [Aquificota bacterium]|nr:MAG: hypothetical protein DRI92_05320 [Aquificota bacterium]
MALGLQVESGRSAVADQAKARSALVPRPVARLRCGAALEGVPRIEGVDVLDGGLVHAASDGAKGQGHTGSARFTPSCIVQKAMDSPLFFALQGNLALQEKSTSTH